MIYTDIFEKEKDFPILKKDIQAGEPVLVKGISANAENFFIRALAEQSKLPAVVILPDEKSAKNMYSAFAPVFKKCYFFPAREFELVNFDSASLDFDKMRLRVINAAAENDFDIIFTTAEALLQATLPKKKYLEKIRVLEQGADAEQDEIIKFLLDAGYARFDKVEGKGQFAKRGDILDIFPPSEEMPVRMEFFGDNIDAMGYFDILSQRRTENIQKIKITPASELFFSEAQKKEMLSFLETEKASSRDAENIAFLGDTASRIESGMGYARDLFLSLNYERSIFLDYFDKKTLIFIKDEKELASEIDGATAILRETLITLAQQKKLISGKGENFLMGSFSEFCDFCNKRATVILDNFAQGRKKIAPRGIFSFTLRDTVTNFRNAEMLSGDIFSSLSEGYITAVAVPNTLIGDNLLSIFNKEEKKAVLIPQNSDIAFEKNKIYIIFPEKDSMPVSGGFESAGAKFRMFCDAETVAKAAPRRKRDTKSKFKEKISSFTDLSIGDYVVHINHGIGIFKGAVKMRSADGSIKDFIKIAYAGSDVLYVPSSNLDSVSKYIGPKSDSANLKLNKMGGTEWKKATSRAKASAKEIASKLIKLYSERMKKSGFAFSRDSSWQREFEDMFPYGETDSQLNAAAEIKRDMEKSIPMDRLLCGDVGFGKTEVALRGVFKCIMDNKQAAILVPTTILAWQHYQTMLMRFKGYPIRIEMLSRFRTKKEQEKIIEKLKKGEIDVVVGTHRLLQKDIAFKDLGFLVVDEEQRFGVSHKERLKEMSAGVDVLTLTATPIPRTLNMALGGIRDMSVLEEAPEDRLPVQTFVFEYDLAVITEAMRRELARGGQVFYLINNIDELQARAAAISRIFPDASISVAHGALDKDSLSDIWRDMTEGKIDILFCTTIIETGIDLPDANTLIIENADRFGLSQLHQLRGRVGRSARKAYAYLTYRKGKSLSEISIKRLEAIREYTEFGSGFKIAMRDLELRGAGNLLGAEQSGHLDSIGYELYMQILSDAVLEEKGEKIKEKTECIVDLPISAYLPDDFIPAESDRLDIYRKIASSSSDEDIEELRDEISDRFGDIPVEVENLFRTVKIKWLGEKCDCTKVRYISDKLAFSFDKADETALALLLSLYASKMFLSLAGKPYFEIRLYENDDMISLCEEILYHLDSFIKENK